MNPVTVTKIDNRKKTTSKKVDGDVISKNYNAIAIFLVYSQFGVIWKPGSGSIASKTYNFINSTLLSYKNCKHN